MTEQLKNKLSDSKTLRWSVLALVAFTMLCGYFLTDVMSPLKPMLEKELLWDSLDYGFFTSAYGWFNVFLLMLISVVLFSIRWEFVSPVWELVY